MSALFLKNMRWFLRDAETAKPYIHIQMLAKDGVGGGNRDYGDAFDVPLTDLHDRENISIAQVKWAIQDDTESLATHKPYTKGKIVAHSSSDSSCAYFMRISLGRGEHPVLFFLSNEADERLKEHADFAVRNGLALPA